MCILSKTTTNTLHQETNNRERAMPLNIDIVLYVSISDISRGVQSLKNTLKPAELANFPPSN
jgi:hypothetical protein